MKKVLLSCLILSGVILANQLSYIPLNKSNLANENGGEKSAIEAYSDGIGIYTVGKFQLDNKAMNELVFVHGEEARKNGETLKEYVLDKGNNKEKDLAEKLGNIAKNIIPSDGTECDDNNNLTRNDVYISGMCIGTLIPVGTACNDGNENTKGDKITSIGVCEGFVDGTSCNDNNSDTVLDIYTNGICKGIVPRSCSDLKTKVPTITTGTYKFDIDNNETTANVSLYCDMTTAGGGWTRIQQVNTSFYTSSNYNWALYSPIISDIGLSYTKFMLKNNGTTIDWANGAANTWEQTGIASELLNVKYTDNTYQWLQSIKDTTLSDTGTLRPCLKNVTTVNTCHTVYVGNVASGKKIKHFWDDEAVRASTGQTDYTNYNTIVYKFDVYVK